MRISRPRTPDCRNESTTPGRNSARLYVGMTTLRFTSSDVDIASSPYVMAGPLAVAETRGMFSQQRRGRTATVSATGHSSAGHPQGPPTVHGRLPSWRIGPVGGG